MKKKYFIALGLIILVLIVLAVWKARQKPAPAVTMPAASQNTASQNPYISPNDNMAAPPATPSNNPSGFEPPLDRAGERVTKKPFGIYITPATSLVQPERFQGYHTGADFEIFPEELNADVSVHAVCSGKLILKEYASGYGGVAVESCQLDNQPIAVIYGHLKLASIQRVLGDSLKTGDIIGLLGADKSVETNGERKHLHLGFHKGASVNILGYVQNKNDLAGWIDPCLYVCHD